MNESPFIRILLKPLYLRTYPELATFANDLFKITCKIVLLSRIYLDFPGVGLDLPRPNAGAGDAACKVGDVGAVGPVPTDY